MNDDSSPSPTTPQTPPTLLPHKSLLKRADHLGVPAGILPFACDTFLGNRGDGCRGPANPDTVLQRRSARPCSRKRYTLRHERHAETLRSFLADSAGGHVLLRLGDPAYRLRCFWQIASFRHFRRCGRWADSPLWTGNLHVLEARRPQAILEVSVRGEGIQPRPRAMNKSEDRKRGITQHERSAALSWRL